MKLLIFFAFLGVLWLAIRLWAWYDAEFEDGGEWYGREKVQVRGGGELDESYRRFIARR